MNHKIFDTDESQFVEKLGCVKILPIPYDLTTSFRPGTRFGPEAILNVAQQVEVFNDDICWDATKYLQFDLEDAVEQNAISAESMMDDIYTRAKSLLNGDDFIFSLGGEHSVSAPLIRAFQEKYDRLHVVQIDAHADLRDEWNGTKYSHACAMRRVTDLGIPLTQIAIRNYSEEEDIFIRENDGKNLFFFKAEDLKKANVFDQLLSHLKSIQDPVYLTIDVDGIDPSVIPATGTPEPGGLSWFETIQIVKQLALNTNLVGADIMELSPHPGLEYANFAAAKLVYKIISYHFYKLFQRNQKN